MKQELWKLLVDIEDLAYDSKYFQIVDLKESYTIGKHYFGIRGSLDLKPRSEIDGEILNQRGQIVPLYLVNQPYSAKRGMATLGFEITTASVQGDMNLTLIGEDRDGNIIRWFRKITAITEYTENQTEYGGFNDLPNNIPVEVSGAFVESDSGSTTTPFSQSWNTIGTGSVRNIKIKWLNHANYSSPYITTQSQGNAYNHQQSPPTFSEINTHQLNNIDKYHIFVFSPDSSSNNEWFTPANSNNYYPGIEDINSYQSGTWNWIDSINAPQGSGSTEITSIEYNIINLPIGKPYYIYIAMTTPYTLQRWANNFWTNLTRGVPKN